MVLRRLFLSSSQYQLALSKWIFSFIMGIQWILSTNVSRDFTMYVEYLRFQPILRYHKFHSLCLSVSLLFLLLSFLWNLLIRWLSVSTAVNIYVDIKSSFVLRNYLQQLLLNFFRSNYIHVVNFHYFYMLNAIKIIIG